MVHLAGFQWQQTEEPCLRIVLRRKSGLDDAVAHGLKRSWLDLALASFGRPLFYQGTFKPIKCWLLGSEGLPRAPVTMAAYAGHHHRSNLRGKLHTLPLDLQRYL